MAEVEELAGDNLAAMDFQYRSRRHQMVDTALKNVVRDRLLEAEAKSRGVSKDDLIKDETGQLEVTQDEVARWYQQNKGRVGGRPLEQLSSQIQQFLLQEKRQKVVEGLTTRLEKENDVVYRLAPLRADISAEGSPAKGSADAPVTVVEFSDFECGFCGRMVKTLDDIKNNFGDEVRIVFRQFPLDMHANARKAAEAALCANDQGKFWPMHDMLFKEQSQLSVVNLKDKASRLGLDRESFDGCLDSGRYAEKVQEDLRAGAAVGVTGTPALFVNGIPVPGGAVPYDVISDAIVEELKRVGAR
jgi:protein-disulfide isomerase